MPDQRIQEGLELLAQLRQRAERAEAENAKLREALQAGHEDGGCSCPGVGECLLDVKGEIG